MGYYYRLTPMGLRSFLLDFVKGVQEYDDWFLRTYLIGCAPGKTKLEVWKKEDTRKKWFSGTCYPEDIAMQIMTKFKNKALTKEDIDSLLVGGSRI